MSYALRKDGEGFRAVDSEQDVGEEEVFSETMPPPPKSLLRISVDAERDRRIDAGFEFRGTPYQSRPTDRENISGAAQLGFMAIVAGAALGDLRWSDPTTDFEWIASDNSMVTMDAFTVVEFGKVAAQRKAALIYAGRALKDMAEVPADYTDDKWWP